MALHKEVVSLEDSCLPKVQYLIQDIIRIHKRKEFADEAKFIEDLKMVVQQVPSILHDQLAEMHLSKIMEEFEDEWELLDDESDVNYYCDCKYESDNSDCSYESYDSSKKCEKCVNEVEVHLEASLKVICLLKIKKIAICEGTMAVTLMNKLIGLLDKMPFIESFTIADSWNIDHELLMNQLLKTAGSWSNLTIFNCEDYCDDELLNLVCNSCELLQEVNVRHCQDLSKPMEPLVICKNLMKVNLENNTLEPEAYLKLLIESKSNNLIEIHGFDSVLYEVLDQLEEMKSQQVFKLQCLRVYKNSFKREKKYLHLMKKYFPSLTKILFRIPGSFDPEIVDFSSILNEVSVSEC